MQPLRFGPVIKKIGLKFAILGHEFAAVLDTGNVTGPRFMLDERTAAAVGIQNFHKSNRSVTVHFIESGVHHFPIYEDIPLTIPGVSTVITDAILGGNNLVNPAIFLPNHDIAFHGNKITFLPKGTPHLGAAIPYLKGNETAFNWEIGHKKLNCLIDTGGDWSIINTKLANDIGLLHYEKIAKWDKDEDNFQFAYIVPVGLSGTPVSFLSEIHIEPGLTRNIISGSELLQNHWGFTLRDNNVEFYRT